jgi:hypothetical protein
MPGRALFFNDDGDGTLAASNGWSTKYDERASAGREAGELGSEGKLFDVIWSPDPPAQIDGSGSELMIDEASGGRRRQLSARPANGRARKRGGGGKTNLYKLGGKVQRSGS